MMTRILFTNIFTAMANRMTPKNFRKNEGGKGGASIVPIAFPLIAGPGALTALLSLRADYAVINIIIALLLNILLDYIVISQLDRIQKLLGENLIFILMISRPRIISTARMNNTNAPATANDSLSMPKSFSKASPAKKKAKNKAKAVRQACPALMVLFCSFMLMKMGMEPKMSIMAAMTMKAPKISTKLMLLNMFVFFLDRRLILFFCRHCGLDPQSPERKGILERRGWRMFLRHDGEALV